MPQLKKNRNVSLWFPQFELKVAVKRFRATRLQPKTAKHIDLRTLLNQKKIADLKTANIDLQNVYHTGFLRTCGPGYVHVRTHRISGC